MDIRLARIDDRLIHGQVATVWSKQTGIDRIIVVSDAVAKDQLRKFLLIEAAPPGVKVNIVTVTKILAVASHPLFANEKLMLLFTNPQDVVQLVRGGIPIKSINIGGMSFSNGKQMITNFVSIDQADRYAFEFLHQKGIEIEVRKVPADRKVYLMELLKKKNKL